MSRLWQASGRLALTASFFARVLGLREYDEAHTFGLFRQLRHQLFHLVAIHERGQMADEAEGERRAIRDRQPVADLVHDVANRIVIRVGGLGGPRRLCHPVSSAV